jgi:hypothetical protein
MGARTRSQPARDSRRSLPLLFYEAVAHKNINEGIFENILKNTEKNH